MELAIKRWPMIVYTKVPDCKKKWKIREGGCLHSKIHTAQRKSSRTSVVQSFSYTPAGTCRPPLPSLMFPIGVDTRVAGVYDLRELGFS